MFVLLCLCVLCDVQESTSSPPPVIDLPNGNKLLIKPPYCVIPIKFQGFLQFRTADIRALGCTVNSSAEGPPNLQVQLWLHGPDPLAIPAGLAKHVKQLEQPPAQTIAALVEAFRLQADKDDMPKEGGDLLVLQLRARAKLYKYVNPFVMESNVRLSMVAMLQHLRGWRYLGVEKVSSMFFWPVCLCGNVLPAQAR
jgi:hypothetical protein